MSRDVTSKDALSYDGKREDFLANPPVRVLVVDDSAFMRTAISRMIASESDFKVVAAASSGAEALDRIAALDPDVVTLDVEMPGLNGLDTLREIMTRFPRPVIMVSSATEKDADATFTALGAGAFDYVPKQLSSTSLDILHIQSDLIAKIRAAAYSRRRPDSLPPGKKPPHSWQEEVDTDLPSVQIVAIGTSTGGPKALQEILPILPRDLSVPVLIVQHMPVGFTAPFAQRLNTLCSVPVREATHHESIQTGVIYIAPAGVHMTVVRASDSSAMLSLNGQPENSLHKPSVDVMMKSVAKTYGASAMGVIMTGMGSDGAEGMKAIHRHGGFTLGQDESTCIVYGMPRACAEMGVLSRVVPLSRIPAQILKATHYRDHVRGA
jgi:two-component system chemotaxis response regulator CheB